MNKRKLLLPLAACLFTFSASFAQKSSHPNSMQQQRTGNTPVNSTDVHTAGTTNAQQTAVRVLIDQAHQRLEQYYKANRKNLSPAQIAYIDSVKTIIDARIRSLSQSNANALH